MTTITFFLLLTCHNWGQGTVVAVGELRDVKHDTGYT